MTDDWRVDSHEREIKGLKEDLLETKEKLRKDLRESNKELRTDLREAEKEIRALERRPWEWLTYAMLAILWIIGEVGIVVAIVEAANKH